MQELLRQVTRAKEVELSVARDAIVALKSEQEAQTESIKQGIRAETAQLRYTARATLAHSQPVGVLPPLCNVLILSFLLCACCDAVRETEMRSRELEGQLRLLADHVTVARSEVEQQQRVTRDQRQQERDRIHAQLQEETHRREVRFILQPNSLNPSREPWMSRESNEPAQAVEHRCNALQFRLGQVEQDVSAARASAAAARDRLQQNTGEMHFGLMEHMAEHTVHETAAGIQHETMRRTLESREKDLFEALREQREREVELVEQREWAEEEMITSVTAARDIISRRDEVAQALNDSQSELDQLRADDQQFEAKLQKRLKHLGDRLHESTTGRRAAELELEQRERALQTLQTKIHGARETLTQEKQLLFALRVDTKEQMLSEVLEETMKAQKAFMNKEQVDRALKSMRAELATTQATTEALRTEMLQCVCSIHYRIALNVLTRQTAWQC